MMNKRKETRLEVIRDGMRIIAYWDVEIEESIQDNGRTIKLFVKKKDDSGCDIMDREDKEQVK